MEILIALVIILFLSISALASLVLYSLVAANSKNPKERYEKDKAQIEYLQRRYNKHDNKK